MKNICCKPSSVPGGKKNPAQPFFMAGRKQKQRFTLKLNKQSFLKDTFPLRLFLLGSDFWLSPRIRECLKGNLKAISFLKRLRVRSTTSSLSPCGDSKDGQSFFCLSKMFHDRLRYSNLTSNSSPGY